MQHAGSTVAAGKRRRLVPDNVVHESGLEERTRGRGATLDEELQDVVTPDLIQHVREITAQFETGPHLRSRGRRTENDAKRLNHDCLLYTSDAADDLLCVDLGGRR